MKPIERIDDKSTPQRDAVGHLLRALRRTPVELERLVVGLSESQMRIKRSADEFSVTENLCHLRDIEIEGYKVRIERILAEDGPRLPDLDGGRLAAERDYNTQSASQALKDFEVARSENLFILSEIQKHQLAREGHLDGVGTISLERLAGVMQEHDEGHISELKVLQRWLLTNTE